MTQNITMFGLINRHGRVHIDFSCYYIQPDIESLAIKLKDRCVLVVQYVVVESSPFCYQEKADWALLVFCVQTEA